MSFRCPHCSRTCLSCGGLTKHLNSAHREVTQEPDDHSGPAFTYQTHPYLTAAPTDSQGNRLRDGTAPLPPPSAPPPHTEEAWGSFNGRLEFDFAYCHFVRRQSSADEIKEALDLQAAQAIRCGYDGHGFPFNTAQEMYQTIDDIPDINVPWETLEIQYNGPRPPVPPLWMTQTYKLVKRDVQQLFHEQMKEPGFFSPSTFNKTPYRQFNQQGERVRSNIMSADWAWKQCDIIAEDPNTHGAMFVPVAAGSDKTTVSVATGHQEYHPVYASPCNLTNVTRRTHPFGLTPVGFLVIPKTTASQRKKPQYQTFVRQLYHASLSAIFEPLRENMTTPEVVLCPDGHFRRVIYGLGPYIADYPEQVWLSGIVSGWCAKCTNPPDQLDRPNANRRTTKKTEFIVQKFDPGIAWDDYGIRSDVVPFTVDFPRADIHELLSPDLLHQVIKGTFKDHLVEWTNQWVLENYPKAEALEILKDINRRINAVPAFPGLRRFPDGRDFSQWTGDDSKALMKVYIAAISGYVPPEMVKAFSVFMDFCYIARRNALTASDIAKLDECLTRFQESRQVFIDSDVRNDISLPRQHALTHYVRGIRLFGSPNGVCSSITESKHIEAVKKTWRRSSRYHALDQMVTTISRENKLKAMRRRLEKRGMMWGLTSSYETLMFLGEVPETFDLEVIPEEEADDELYHDLGPVSGPPVTSSVHLAAKPADGYPSNPEDLGHHISIPQFHTVLRRYLWSLTHPDVPPPPDTTQLPVLGSRIKVFHSAVAKFYAPSDICGAGGMHSERIRSHPEWRQLHARRDTLFVHTNQSPLMGGYTIARAIMFFAFKFGGQKHECVLVNWFSRVGDAQDEDTGMWVVKPEFAGSIRTLEVISIDSVARACHLLPVFGKRPLPEEFTYEYALTAFKAYFVNKHASVHLHEFLDEDE
ncbi:hypothetical protein V5O48_016435 [Marasmius crinis-equi]|uniref:C2H2-type domain-containing protein n=1 Tax=Marasmius crinis-equi TaxID=585013 RepID=A0ABR3ERQ2_9AGAR